MSGNIDYIQEAIIGIFANFTGSRLDLRGSVNVIRGAINRLGDTLDVDENVMARFAALPGIQPETLHAIQLKIEEIKTLKLLLGGDLREINGRQVSVNYTPHDWFVEELRLIHTQLNGELLTRSLQQPNERLSQQPLWDAANPPNFLGFVREKEAFDLPPEAPWNSRRIITVTDIPATHSFRYAHDNEALQSIPREVYRIQHEGEADETLDGNELPAVLYRIITVDRAAVPNTVNLATGNVTLSIHRCYQRADGSQYDSKKTIDAHPINRGAVRYENDDQALSPRRFVTYFATHEGVEVPLGEYPEEAAACTPENVELTMIPGTLNVGDSTIFLRIRRLYNRPDASTYAREEVLANYQIAKALQRYDHDDDNLRSTEIVRCSTNHEGVSLQLGDHMDRSFDYTPGDIRREMVPGTLNLDASLGVGTVSLSINRAYNRADGTLYEREERVDNQPIQKGSTRYTPEDANLRSVRHVMYRANYDVNLEERQDGYEAYTLGDILRCGVAANTLNLARNIVELNITRAYHRPDNTVYEKDKRVASAIIRGQEKLVEDDANLRFIRYAPCSTIYDNVFVDLGEHMVGEVLPYTKEQIFSKRVNALLDSRVSRAVKDEILVFYRDHEEVFKRFLRGVLIYKPNKENDVGRVELAISEFLTRGQNPLESTFDLSGCGDAGKYISISTGYRREATKSVNPTKWEVFITPKFLIEAHKTTTASHYAAITNASRTAPFAVIQDYGAWSDINWYCYYTYTTVQELNTQSLYALEQRSMQTAPYYHVDLDHISSYQLHANRTGSNFIFNFS